LTGDRFSKSSINRREFLRRAAVLSGAAALAAELEGCVKTELYQVTQPASPTSPVTVTPVREPTSPATMQTDQPGATQTHTSPSPTPAEVIPEGSTQVAFVKTNTRAEGVRQALNLLGINTIEGKRVLLKPNFNSFDPTPGSTHVDVLTALVLALKEMGADTITVGDRSGMGDTRKVMERIGVFSLAEELGFDTVVFDELSAEDWVMIEPPDSHWEKGFPIARPAVEAEAVVSTCCLKTHRYGGHFSMSLKNSVGMVASRIPQGGYNFMSELHSSPHQRRMIAEINAVYNPALIVLDGVEAFISAGPDVGERVSSEVIIAGTDRIAIDAIGVALLRNFGCQTEVARGKIFAQEQIARAVELGLGVDNPDKIEFLTSDAESAEYCERIREILLAG